jgi:hypothetical protein
MARVARSARTRASHVGNTVPTAASRARLSEERAVRARPKDGRKRAFSREFCAKFPRLLDRVRIADARRTTYALPAHGVRPVREGRSSRGGDAIASSVLTREARRSPLSLGPVIARSLAPLLHFLPCAAWASRGKVEEKSRKRGTRLRTAASTRRLPRIEPGTGIEAMQCSKPGPCSKPSPSAQERPASDGGVRRRSPAAGNRRRSPLPRTQGWMVQTCGTEPSSSCSVRRPSTPS